MAPMNTKERRGAMLQTTKGVFMMRLKTGITLLTIEQAKVKILRQTPDLGQVLVPAQP